MPHYQEPRDVRMKLAALQMAEEDEVVKKLEMRVEEEQEVASSWMKRVSFSLRK